HEQSPDPLYRRRPRNRSVTAPSRIAKPSLIEAENPSATGVRRSGRPAHVGASSPRKSRLVLTVVLCPPRASQGCPLGRIVRREDQGPSAEPRPARPRPPL